MKRLLVLGLTCTTALGLATPAVAAGAAAPAVRPTLNAPTGPAGIGRVDLRLVDQKRPDPWIAGRPYREVMASVWYPARDVDRYPPAPYVPSGVASAIDPQISDAMHVPRGTVDWRGIRGRSHLGAPPDQRGGAGPVVVYSPQHYGLRGVDTSLAEELASHGYVVVAVDDTHEAGAVEFPGGRVEQTKAHVLPPTLPNGEMDLEKLIPLLRKTVATRVADARFVLDVLGRGAAPRDLTRVMDLSRVGAVGVNMGSTTAMQLAKEDRRVRGAVSLADDPGSAEMAQAPVVVEGMDKPFLHLGVRLDDPEQQAKLQADWDSLWPRLRGWKLDLEVAGATDVAFMDYKTVLPQVYAELGRPVPADIQGMLGAISPVRADAVRRAYTAAFFDRFLRHRGSDLLNGPSPAYPEVTFIR